MAIVSAGIFSRAASRGLFDSLTRKLLQAFLLGRNVTSLLAVRKVLLSPGLACILQQNPRIPFKFVGNYLSLGLTWKNRLNILLHHYRYVDARFHDRFFAGILQHPFPLWQQNRRDDTYAIGLSICDFDLEGELSLILTRNGQRVCVLSFAVAPGSELGLDDRNVLLVSRIQGARNPDMIRTTTKALGEVSPPAMLLTASRGIAQALGISCLAGVSSAVQVSIGEETPPEQARFFGYDEFWGSKGGIRMKNDLFRLHVTPHSRPVEAIRGKHRTRTLRKRQFDDELLATCRQRFGEACLKSFGSRIPLPYVPVTAWVYLAGIFSLC